MNNYTLIAYKPNSASYCRNCLMESYSSNFVLEVHLSREELIKNWVDILVKKDDLGHSERGYGITILRDGYKAFDNNYCYVSYEYIESLNLETFNEEQKIEDELNLEMNSIYNEVKEKVKLKLEEIKNKLNLEQKRLFKEKQDKANKDKLELYNKLKAELNK